MDNNTEAADRTTLLGSASTRDVSRPRWQRIPRGARHITPITEATLSLTSDPNDPRLRRGVDDEPVGQNDTYLVLSEEERAKGFVRPLRRAYVHRYWLDGRADPLPTVLSSLEGLGGCGACTTMGTALCETYARDPSFYGATFCVGCNMHRPVAEFRWDEDGAVVGS